MRVRAFLSLLLIASAALAAERVGVLPGVGIVVESDQERIAVIPGSGIFAENLAAPGAARRVILISSLEEPPEPVCTNPPSRQQEEPSPQADEPIAGAP